jgi:hypothetical protein
MHYEDLMPDFTYVGDDERYYPSLSLSVAPGDTVTLDSDPGDGRFAAKGSRKSVTATAPTDDSPEVGQ